MSNDFAEQMALGVYGKSGRANAPENQNEDFKHGYAVGVEIEDAMQAIRQEWIRLGRPEKHSKSFEEWKRGMWAALLQRRVAEALIRVETHNE
jgi:hypothetical protein